MNTCLKRWQEGERKWIGGGRGWSGKGGVGRGSKRGGCRGRGREAEIIQGSGG